MIALGFLHQSPWTWNVVAWITGFGLLLIAFGAALWITDLLRPRGRALVERTLFAFGPAAFAPLIFFAGLRVLQRIEPDLGDGPQHWLFGWVPGFGQAFVHPYDTVVSVHIVSAALVAAIALGTALALPPQQGRAPASPIPGRLGASVLLAAVALLVPFLAFRVYVRDDDAARLLDLVGMAPAVATAVALRLWAWLPPPPPRARTLEAAPDLRPTIDAREAWVGAGLLRSDAASLLSTTPAVRSSQAGPRALAAWTAIRAEGAPPEALDTLLEQLPWRTARASGEKSGAADAGAMGPARIFCLGSIPRDGEDFLLAAVLTDLVGVHGMRVLVVHPDPEGLVARVRSALVHARTWSPGTLVVGPDALQEQLAGKRAPALAAMRMAPFAQDFVRLASGPARSWVAGLDLIVMHRPDLGTPVEVTHTTFACARWDLATRRTNRPPVLLTLPESGALDAFAERLFPGRGTVRVRYGARSAGATRVWPGIEPDGTAPLPWLARASRAITDREAPVLVLDPAGRWSRDVLPAEARLEREPRWDEAASVAELRPAGLVDAVATLPNRLPVPEAHDSLWRIPDEPVARFLHPARLDELTRSGRLPRAVPLVGTRNRYLRLAHLDLALREALNDEHSLRSAFGDDLVDFRLQGAESVAREQTASAWREHGRVVRSHHLSSTAPIGAVLHAGTVTGDVVEVVDARSNEVLERVDARLAPTRFYPKRVFSLGERRYRVPMHAYDEKRRKLAVQLAAGRDHVTRPICSFSLTVERPTVDRVTRRHGTFEMHTSSADCSVVERVHAAWVPALDQEERFDAVQSAYSTEVRFVFPTRATKGLGLFHLAAVVEALLPLFLRCEDTDVAVSPVPEGFRKGMGAGIAVIDRYPGGMGMARALDDGALAEVLTWARTMLYECSCMEGCRKCTPSQVLRVGTDKQAVLQMLEGI